ncbi:MAG: hypothetical protein M1140_00300 [Chloroflexi bacterium]|nr:hypothetical protein [Chloroflexota bacterium]
MTMVSVSSVAPLKASAPVIDPSVHALAAPPATGQSPLAPAIPNSFTWYDGLIDKSTIINCASIIQGFPYQEYGAGTYVGFLADLNAGKPAPNDIYYIHVVIGGLGNSCSGMRAYPDIALPASTSLAIDAGHHVYCLYDGAQISPASACPQSLPASGYHSGAYAIPSTDAANGNTWPIAPGHILEFQIPVKSSTALSNSPLVANVWMLDGNSSPWLLARQGVYVFSSQPALPTIGYPIPSTITVTTTSAHSEAYLYTYGAGGTGYFDLGTTASYGLIHEMVPIAAGYTAWVAWDEWGPPALTPDTLYHWRFIFTPSGGSTVYGADQTFRTLPDGRVTVGTGSPTGCTETALNSALATAKDIRFDCGVLPITITLSSAHSIASNLTINGGNKVILKSNGAVNHFNVQAGAYLTLTQITLSNGLNTADCGGSIKVFANAQLTLNETRFINNRSNAQGGALCNLGIADISATFFMSNTSSTHGGAIGNYGSLRVTNSKFMSNTAAINGGGIDMVGSAVVTNSTFIHNTAGYRGGGINSYYGTLTLVGSSFISNTANLYGGGLANDASFTTASGSTFSDNFSANLGGGLETSGVGALTLINSTVSANRAISDGGGLYWYPGLSTGPITITNSTIANNVAGTLGGNIYADPSWYPRNPRIQVKNTLIVFGSPTNCSNWIVSQGNNLENTNSCGLATALGDKINTNPTLGPLQNNGGATWTRALLLGSPAIDAGTNIGCPATDQRGVTRPIDGNRDGVRVCDIGAYEYQFQTFLPLLRRTN